MESPPQNLEQDHSCSKRPPSPKQVTKRIKIAPAVPSKPVKKISTATPAAVTDGVAAAQLSVTRETLLQCQNLTKLPLLYPQTVLECVRERCLATEYYTWAGPTLVAVNPCHSVPGLYKEAEVLHYHQALQRGVSPLRPHVYAVAGTAEHRRVCGLGRTNQAVVVSGESGAGKTESARYMLSYLCQVEDFANGDSSSSLGRGRTASHAHRPPVYQAPDSDSGFDTSHGPDAVVARTQAKVLASNPLLEAFGNAATLRNHNSSRFGKLLRLQYGGNELRGAVVDTYLLEKTRVTHQPQGERNFHILHQVVAGIQAGILSVDGCRVPSHPPQPPTSLPLFTITPITTPDDVRGLHWTLAALDQLSFSRAYQDNLLRVLVALLHLGNVQFEVQSGSSSGCVVTNSSLSSLARASGLLGVTCEQLSEALTVRTIAVPTKDRVSVFRHSCERPVECCERRSACMQLLYHGLFAHLITAVNEQIAAKPRHAWSHFIGILDVYGFEVFEHNSLEQLCINYANERLQQAFIETFLRTEQQVLLEEGVVVDESNFKDNSGCLTALHSPVSVFAILNEECQLQRAVDEVAACERVCRALQHSEFVYSPVNSRSKKNALKCPTNESLRPLAPSPTGFVVRHYAGPVHYSPVSLLAKNKDLVPGEVVALLGQSVCAFVAGLLDQDACRGVMGTTATTQQEKMTSRWSSSPTLSTPTTAPPPEFHSSSITPHDTGSLRRPSTPTAPHNTPNTGGSSTGSLRRGARKVTTLSKFKSSLDSLLGTLASCDLHYVRCVKPNRQAVAGTTNDDYLMSQLSACGILDTVAVCRAGYPVRMVFEEFCDRYEERSDASKGKEEAQRILKENVSRDRPDQADLFSVGKRRVFLSEATFRQLEAVRDHKRATAACIIQTNWRRTVCMRSYRCLRSAAATVVRCAATWRARRHFLQTRSAAITLQRYVRGRNERFRFRAFKESSVIIQRTVRMWLARKRFLKLRRSVVLLQGSLRRVLAQRSLRAMKMMRVTVAESRSPSNYSITSSLNSFGYQTGSLSLYSLESASHTPSPDHALTNMADAITSNSNVSQSARRQSLDRLLRFPPTTRRSVLETEESGIETDTESMSGDIEATDGDDQSRVRRRRAKLRQMQLASGELVEEAPMSGASTDTQNEKAANTAPAERLPVHISVRARHNRLSRSTSAGPNQNPSSSVPIPSRTELQNVAQFSQSKVDPFGPTSNDVPSSVTVRRRKRKSVPSASSDPNLVRINSSHQLKTVLGMFATKPEVQFMYSSENRDFYFKDGIISQRRIPPVPVRFHTRATCLPFSHHLPRGLQPQGLIDALQ